MEVIEYSDSLSEIKSKSVKKEEVNSTTFDNDKQELSQRKFVRMMRAQERETLRGLPVKFDLNLDSDTFSVSNSEQ